MDFVGDFLEPHQSLAEPYFIPVPQDCCLHPRAVDERPIRTATVLDFACVRHIAELRVIAGHRVVHELYVVVALSAHLDDAGGERKELLKLLIAKRLPRRL